MIPKHIVLPTPAADADWKLIKEVNSYHNFGIKKLGASLKCLLEAEDGTCEAFHHDSLNFSGILWHPERYPEFRKEDITIFRNKFNS